MLNRWRSCEKRPLEGELKDRIIAAEWLWKRTGETNVIVAQHASKG